MDILRAIEILGALAQGVDPYSGEVFEEAHVCNQPDTIRAFYCILRELEKPEETFKKRPENAGKPWEKEDDEKLWKLFREGMEIKELQVVFKRSRGSIMARLEKIMLRKQQQDSQTMQDQEKKVRMKNAADTMQRVLYSERIKNDGHK